MSFYFIIAEPSLDFLAGDLAVASETGLNCSLAEITGFLPAAVNTIQHVMGAYDYVNTANQPVNATATYNKAGGSGVGYSANALLFTLGRSPSVVTYQIGNDKLQSSTLIPYLAAPTADIGDGIVQLKALYGKDTNPDPLVDTLVWDTTLPGNATQWLQLRAVRIALLARSAKFEKTAVTADCVWPTAPNPPYPAPNSPYWSGGCFAMTNLTGGGSATENDWHRYRYRVYETVVPLRNMIWSN